jgi:hypothetical protein
MKTGTARAGGDVREQGGDESLGMLSLVCLQDLQCETANRLFYGWLGNSVKRCRWELSVFRLRSWN